MAALDKLPQDYHDTYHYLLSLCVQFIVHYFDGRRGAEGIQFLTKNHWKVFEENGKKYLKKVLHIIHCLVSDNIRSQNLKKKYFFKVLGESSKNHPTGSEILENSGSIFDYLDPSSGLNAFRLFELYLLHLNPNTNRLFQKEKRGLNKFKIHDYDNMILYENSPKGEHKIASMLPTLTEILGKPRLTNHSIRTQTIRTLIRLGYSEHEVTQFTGTVCTPIVDQTLVQDLPLKIPLEYPSKSCQAK